MRRIWLAGIVIAMGAAAWGAELPTADEVLAKMKAKWAGMKSFEMDEKTTVDVGDPNGGLTISTHKVAERWKKEGKVAERSVGVERWLTKEPEGKVVTEEDKNVNDGTYFWEETRNSERVGISVRKDRHPRGDDKESQSYFELHPKRLEDSIRHFDIKVAGEETVEGQKMYVLEGGRKPTKADGKIRKTKFWIGEDDLVIRRIVVTGDDGKIRTRGTYEVSNVKVDEKIDPKVFEYVAPEGAVVEDRTKK